jgi:hypothetical protein
LVNLMLPRCSCKSGTTDYHSLLQVISIVKKLWAKIVSQVWTLMLFWINWNVFHLLWLCMCFSGNTWYSSIRDHKACSFLSPFISRGRVTDERPTIGKPHYSTGFFYFVSREYFSLPNRFVLLPFLILLLWYSIGPEKLMESSFTAAKEFEEDQRGDVSSSSSAQCDHSPCPPTLNS